MIQCHVHVVYFVLKDPKGDDDEDTYKCTKGNGCCIPMAGENQQDEEQNCPTLCCPPTDSEADRRQKLSRCKKLAAFVTAPIVRFGYYTVSG